MPKRQARISPKLITNDPHEFGHYVSNAQAKAVNNSRMQKKDILEYLKEQGLEDL